MIPFERDIANAAADALAQDKGFCAALADPYPQTRNQGVGVFRLARGGCLQPLDFCIREPDRCDHLMPFQRVLRRYLR